MAGDTKQRMIKAAASSLRERGLAATSLTDVIAASGAARGAIYHHFPGGKNQLAKDAVAWTGQRVRAEFDGMDAADPDAVLTSFLDLIRPVVAQAAGGVSCAVAAVTVEAAQSDATLTAAVGEAFQSWVDALDLQLRRAGVPAPNAHAVALVMIAFLEGSQVLARAAGDLAGFDESATALLRAARALCAADEAGKVD